MSTRVVFAAIQVPDDADIFVLQEDLADRLAIDDDALVLYEDVATLVDDHPVTGLPRFTS